MTMNELEKVNENVKNYEVELNPINTNVIVKFYDENPYRAVEKTASGLIVGLESTKKYKSNETGEMETNDEVVACAKVIAVGPECKQVRVGDDVFVTKIHCTPVPFRKKGYYMRTEQNVMCCIRPKPSNTEGIQGAKGCSCDIANDKEQWESTPEIYNDEYVKQMKVKKYGNN